MLDSLLEEERLGSLDSGAEQDPCPNPVNNGSTEKAATSWETVAKAGLKALVDDSGRQAAVLQSNATLVHRLFHVRIRSEVTYAQKKYSSATFTHAMHLSLALTYSLPLGDITLTVSVSVSLCLCVSVSLFTVSHPR